MNRAYKRTPQTYKGAAGETAVVDKVLLTSNDENHFIIKCLIRQTRRPEVLDSTLAFFLWALADAVFSEGFETHDKNVRCFANSHHNSLAHNVLYTFNS